MVAAAAAVVVAACVPDRFGRCIYTGEGHTLPYCPAISEVFSRLLPHVARCPLDAFAADGWVIRLLGRGGGRLSANRLATLRLRQATPGDGPTHWAIASVQRAHGAELVELSAGLSAARRWGPGGRHHPTGYLAYWLGAAGGPASPPPPPAPWGPVGPCAWPQQPVTLARLRRVSFLGSVGAADVAALADAAPRLTHLHLMGAVAAGALGALALPALPELDSLALHTVHVAAHLRDELPRALGGRPRLAVLRLPDGGTDAAAARGWV